MMVIILEKVSSSLKGELTRWLLEPKSGVFIGIVSTIVREKLWSKILSEQGMNGTGLMFYSTNSEQGYEVELFGKSQRGITDFEGLKLVKISEE